MSSELYIKEFEKTAEVLPFAKYGLATLKDFQKAEQVDQWIDQLKKAGLSEEEIKLYKENEQGLISNRNKIETEVLQSQLQSISNKINLKFSNDSSSTEEKACISIEKLGASKHQIQLYPEGHPMNSIKQIEQNLFRHHTAEHVLPVTKRRKILRHLERRKERILAQANKMVIDVEHVNKVERSGSLWDIKEMPSKSIPNCERSTVIGPKKQTLYTIKDNKIVRLEPLHRDTNEFKAVDIVLPKNHAEAQLLEGTKMSIEDIKNIDRFKDYEPGVPSKTLFVKNIASSIMVDQLYMLFNKFTSANGGPIDVRLMSGRMRGQAFITFNKLDTAVQALEDINGTILSGRPVIVLFGRNSNKVNNNI